jgi:hypothetical protein
MFLTAANLAHYLFFRGLAPPEAVVDGDYAVVEAGRRHRNFLVRRPSGGGLFVKQSSTAGDTAATLQREAAFYQALRDRPAFARYARVAPRLVDYDPAAMALSVELLPDCENLTEYHLRVGGYPEDVAALVGTEMGAYHDTARFILGEPMNRTLFVHAKPWVFLVDAAALCGPGFGTAGVQLANLLTAYPELLSRVRELAAGWRPDCVVHGDLKWDNLLVGPAGAGLRFHVIDWELADVGDAGWDVGSVLAAYLSYWIWATVAARQARPDLVVPGPGDGREEMTRAVRRFWSTYAAARGFTGPTADAELTRGVQFCAARLVVTAYEYLFNSGQATDLVASLLLTADLLLKDPVNQAREWAAA